MFQLFSIVLSNLMYARLETNSLVILVHITFPWSNRKCGKRKIYYDSFIQRDVDTAMTHIIVQDASTCKEIIWGPLNEELAANITYLFWF